MVFTVGRRVLPTLLSILEQDWPDEAACGQVKDPDLFHGPDIEPREPLNRQFEREYAAKQVCAGCPVRAECLAWALATGEPYGVWGGLDPRERQKLRRRRAVA